MHITPADIDVTIPALVQLQDCIEKHERLTYELQSNLRRMENIKLKIRLAIKEEPQN